ncbi:MAG: hypothetical protein AB7P33_14300, partial [Dehalococcoidia bacterium]
MNTFHRAAIFVPAALILLTGAACTDAGQASPSPTPQVTVPAVDEVPTPLPTPEPSKPPVTLVGADLLALQKQMAAAVKATSMPGEYA